LAGKGGRKLIIVIQTAIVFGTLLPPCNSKASHFAHE
jgi:hypothetical protein